MPSSPSIDPIAVSERDMLGALEVLARASDDPRVFLILTDEEILGLDGRAGLEVLGSPFLDQEGVDAQSAANGAIRSLIARRLVNPLREGRENEGEMITGDGDPSERSVQLERELAGVLTLRRVSRGMLTVTRDASNVVTTLGYYFFPEGGVLEEYVVADGFHHFSVPERSAITERIALFVDPHGAAAQDGPVEPVTDAATAGLADTRVMSVLTSVGEDEGRQATVFTTSELVRVLDNGPLGDDAEHAEPAISDVSPQTLRALIDTMLPAVEDDAPSDEA